MQWLYLFVPTSTGARSLNWAKRIRLHDRLTRSLTLLRFDIARKVLDPTKLGKFRATVGRVVNGDKADRNEKPL
jgi:hypothetical protein